MVTKKIVTIKWLLDLPRRRDSFKNDPRSKNESFGKRDSFRKARSVYETRGKTRLVWKDSIALIKSVFDFLFNVLLEIYFRIRALTKYLTNETEEYKDLILLF